MSREAPFRTRLQSADQGGVIFPNLPAASSVNQMLPSGPAAIPLLWTVGVPDGVGTANSVITCVDGLIFAIRSAGPASSVNQMLPSGPAAMLIKSRSGAVNGNEPSTSPFLDATTIWPASS